MITINKGNWALTAIVVLFLFLISCHGNRNLKNNEITDTKSRNTTLIVDSTLAYADDIIDDSTLIFLDSLPKTKDISTYNIELHNNISVGEYSYFLNTLKDYPVIIQNGKISKRLVDSLNQRNGFVFTPKIYTSFLLKVEQYLETTDSFQRKKDNLIAGITVTALHLTHRDDFKYTDKGADMPAQDGLAYSWGIKDYSKRSMPVKYDSIKSRNGKMPKDTCQYKIYGLDCSGFVAVLFKENGIKIIDGNAEAQRNIKYLKKILQPYFSALNFDVIDLTHITSSEVQTGDIVYRYSSSAGKATHIGLILKDLDGTLKFCEAHGNPGDCLGNLSSGPHMSNLSKIEGSNYRIIRIVSK